MRLNFSNLLSSINWFGVIAGVFMLALPFMGPWWIGRAGTGAMEIALSPFDLNASFMGQPLSSSLVGLFLLFAKISMLIAGTFMILGSIFTKQWWSRQLVRFGVMKPFWMIIMLMVMLLIGTVIFNSVLPGVISGMASEAGGSAGGAVQTSINIPYISGTATSTIALGSNVAITAPVTLSLTGTFGVAVFVAALCIVARIYHRRFTRSEKLEQPEEEKRVIKVKPAEPKKVIKVKPAEEKKVIKVRPK